jgi:hypothetical protein
MTTRPAVTIPGNSDKSSVNDIRIVLSVVRISFFCYGTKTLIISLACPCVVLEVLALMTGAVLATVLHYAPPDRRAVVTRSGLQAVILLRSSAVRRVSCDRDRVAPRRRGQLQKFPANLVVEQGENGDIV